MTQALTIAQHYFELSNKSDFEGIGRLFTETTTYSSQTTGLYLGRDDILAMQRAFHDKFAALEWKVTSVKEVKPTIILFNYDFTGTLPSGEKVTSSGLEYIIVLEGKIQHIEIRNKSDNPNNEPADPSSLPTGDSLRQLQAYIWQMNKDRGFNLEDPSKKLVMLMEEMGELAKATRKVAGMKFTDTTKQTEIKDELADVQIVLLGLASLLKVDMLEVVREKEAKNRRRTWK